MFFVDYPKQMSFISIATSVHLCLDLRVQLRKMCDGRVMHANRTLLVDQFVARKNW